MSPEEFEYVNAFVRLTDDEVAEWHSRADEWERGRIFDLIQEYRSQLVIKQSLLTDVKITDLTEAKSILARFL